MLLYSVVLAFCPGSSTDMTWHLSLSELTHTHTHHTQYTHTHTPHTYTHTPQTHTHTHTNTNTHTATRQKWSQIRRERFMFPRSHVCSLYKIISEIRQAIRVVNFKVVLLSWESTWYSYCCASVAYRAVVWGGGFNPLPRNSEDPPKSFQTQPDCENR